MFYSEVIKLIFDKLEVKERKRMLNHINDSIRSMGQEHSINFEEISMDKLIKFRIINAVCQYMLFCVEYGLCFTFTDEIRNSNEMKAFFADFNKWM